MIRSQARYDAFTKAVDLPMLVITIAWLPVLVVPLVVQLHGTMAETRTAPRSALRTGGPSE